MRHVTHMNEVCYSYERDMSRICTRHIVHTNKARGTYELSYHPASALLVCSKWISEVSQINFSCNPLPWYLSVLRFLPLSIRCYIAQDGGLCIYSSTKLKKVLSSRLLSPSLPLHVWHCVCVCSCVCVCMCVHARVYMNNDQALDSTSKAKILIEWICAITQA